MNSKSNSKSTSRLHLLPVLLFLVAIHPLAAFSDDDSSDVWQHSLDIYLLGPTIEGTAGIGPADADVDVDAGTVFDSLQGAFLGMYTGEKNGWGVLADIVYMDLEADISLANGIVTGEAGNKQFTGAVAATRRVHPNWKLMAGVMYTDISMTLKTEGPLNSRHRSRSESWIDPYVGASFESSLSEKWGFSSFGYLGGFGVGSDLMWSLNAGLGYRVNENNSFTLFYRYIDFDYEDGTGQNRFKFDIAEHGPAVGWRFRF